MESSVGAKDVGAQKGERFVKERTLIYNGHDIKEYPIE
jgi:hypothetical protein